MTVHGPVPRRCCSKSHDRSTVGYEDKFPYQATIDWLVDAIPDADARDKIFGANARGLYFGGG